MTVQYCTAQEGVLLSFVAAMCRAVVIGNNIVTGKCL